VLSTGFTARNGGANGRAPGVARPFYPTANENRKPWIFVSGGDDGRAYYLLPTSESPTDWLYQRVVVADLGPSVTVSGMAAADIEVDGYVEFFVSVYGQSAVNVYTMKP